MITNDKGRMFGKYCGPWTGKVIIATGNRLVLTFVTDSFTQDRGFLIYFNAVSLGKNNKYVKKLILAVFRTPVTYELS